MASATYQVRFIHRDDFIYTRNYLTTYAGDVAATYEDDDIFDFDMPDPDSYIDSGGTFQSTPRPKRAQFKLILDAWLQEFVIDPVDEDGLENEINGFLTHIALIYRRSSIGTETLIMSGVMVYDAGTSRNKEVALTVYDFGELWQKMLDLEITIGVVDAAGILQEVDEVLTVAPGEYHFRCLVADGAAQLPLVGEEISFRIFLGSRWVRVVHEVVNMETETAIVDDIEVEYHYVTFRSTINYTPTLLGYGAEYRIYANRGLFDVTNLLNEMFTQANSLLFQTGTGIAKINAFAPQAVQEYISEQIYLTGYVDFAHEGTPLVTESFAEKAIGLYVASDMIRLIVYDYSFSHTYTDPYHLPSHIREILRLKIVEFNGALWRYITPDTSYQEDWYSYEAHVPTHTADGRLWGTFETTLDTTLEDDRGNEYVVYVDGSAILYTGSTFFSELLPEYGSQTYGKLWEVISFLDSLTYTISPSGLFTVINKYIYADVTPVTLADSQIVGGTKGLPTPKKLAFDTQALDLEWIFKVTGSENEWFGVEELEATVWAKYELLFPVKRGLEVIHSSSGYAPDIEKGDHVVLNDRVYYCFETEPVDGLRSKKFTLRFWDVSAVFEFADGAPVIVSGDLQAVAEPIGIPVLDSNGRLIYLSDGSIWVLDTRTV